MPSIKDLSEAELEVMQILWELGQGTVKEVQAALPEERRLAYTTVATLLNRLREKGYIAAQEKNFAYEFHPLVAREQVIRRKLDDLVRQVFKGNLAPLAAYIAENRKLTPEQLDALEQIVHSEKNDTE